MEITMKRCTRCLMPETWSGITFDKDGVCTLCQEYDNQEKIDWKNRQRALQYILNTHRINARMTNNKYHCIVGYSGGKDTAYTLWAAVKKYKMRPLVVTFDHGFNLGPEATYNLREIPKELDCDHLTFSIGKGLRNSLCKQGSKHIGDFCIHCHLGVGAFPARISKNFGIPLQIWGEPTSLYQTTSNYKLGDIEEQDKEHFEKTFASGIRINEIVPSGYELFDLMPLTWPGGDFALNAIYLGNYEKWDQEEHVRIIKSELGWKDYPKQETWQSWDKNDCPLELVREWQKYSRRGFGKASFAASKEIREGKISREEGMRLVDKYEGKELTGLDELIAEMGMTPDELMGITNKEI